MHRSERLDVLLRLLSERPGITAKRACAELEISERSFYRDLGLLRRQGYPIEGSVGRGGGLRLHPSWGLGKIFLSAEQSVGVLLSLAISEKLALPFFSSELRPARHKITSAFASVQKAQIRRLKDRIFVGRPASSAVSASYKAPDAGVMRVLEKAFLLETGIMIRYVDEQGKETEREIEPHGLFSNWPAWYLLCHDHLRSSSRVFRLDRVKGATPTGRRFRPNATGIFDQLIGTEFGASL